MDNDIVLLRWLQRLNRITHTRYLAWCSKPSTTQKCSFPSWTHTCRFTLIKRHGRTLRTPVISFCQYICAHLNHPALCLDLWVWRPSNASPGRLRSRRILDGMKKMQSSCYSKMPSCLRSDGQNLTITTCMYLQALWCGAKPWNSCWEQKSMARNVSGTKEWHFYIFLEDSTAFAIIFYFTVGMTSPLRPMPTHLPVRLMV